MLRATLAIALSAGVTLAAGALAAPSPARPAASAVVSARATTAAKPRSSTRTATKQSAKSTKSTKSANTSKRSKSAKHAKATKSAKAKSTRTAKLSRTSGVARTGDNMPRGFVWPPSQVMRDAEAACQRDLDAAGVAWAPATSEGHIAAAVTIDDLSLGGIKYVSVYRPGPHKMDCQLARALALIGPELAAVGVREIHFGSIYRWSNVRVGGQTKNVLSRHALGLAMDVVSFVDAAGREAHVARDYPAGDPLLLDVEHTLNASGSFRIVLTPKNDPRSHHDHFHFEANPSYGPPMPRS